MSKQSNLQSYGALLLATRFKRLSEAMYVGVDANYRALGVDLSSRCFPILFLLRDHGAMSITALANELGQTHSAVSQLSRRLLAAQVVDELANPADERQRMLRLTKDGQAMMAQVTPVWGDVCAAVDVVCGNKTADLLNIIERMEHQLSEAPFADFIASRKRERDLAAVEIIPYSVAYRDDFKRLNIEWLERYFYVEEIDHVVLSDPDKNIIVPGGSIFFARLRDEIIGVCALIKMGDGRYELSKMAVTAASQGLGIGRRLIERVIDDFKQRGAKTLYLETNSKLKPAIALYESIGFVHEKRPNEEVHYQRANVYMVWRP